MGVLDILKQKTKKIAVGVALGGALFGAGCSKGNIEEIKDNEAKMEQRADNKSEIRQKIAYLDEYVAAVESGKNKEQAYQEFALKMADGNTTKIAEMEKQAKEIQGQVKDLQKKGSSNIVLLSFCIAFAMSATTATVSRAILKAMGSRQNE